MMIFKENGDAGGNCRVNDLARSYPDEGTLYTRDGKRFSHTGDFLFLCAMLKNLTGTINCVSILTDKSQKVIAALTDSSGNAYHPVTGKPLHIDLSNCKSRINRKTIRSSARSILYRIRRALSRRVNFNSTLEISGKIIFKAKYDEVNFSELNSTLIWPITVEEDLCINFYSHLASFITPKETESFDALCPVDGPVKVVRGRIISPDWTWEELCGREQLLCLCPHCLAELDVRAGMMS